MSCPSSMLLEDSVTLVDNELKNFSFINGQIESFMGGLKDKCILEAGARFHSPPWGISCALLLLKGAKRVFGIDIGHPCLACFEERRQQTWKVLNEKVSSLNDIGYLQESNICVSQDMLWNDNQYNKLTMLQMSASQMYFRDDMFDLVISKATFEHLNKPYESLLEMKRVTKAGGFIYINWNPFTSLRMGGHDIGIPYYYPWAHLRLTKEEHVKKLKEVYSNKELYNSMPIEHRPNDELAAYYIFDIEGLHKRMLEDLNQIRVGDFLRMVEETGLNIIHLNTPIIDEERKYLTPQIRKELNNYSEEELLMVNMDIVLQK